MSNYFTYFERLIKESGGPFIDGTEVSDFFIFISYTMESLLISTFLQCLERVNILTSKLTIIYLTRFLL